MHDWNRTWVPWIAVAFLLIGPSYGLGPTSADASDITYVYDGLGRLIAVVDPAGDTAVYSYDAVGNLLSISRQSSALVSVIDFSPGEELDGSGMVTANLLIGAGIDEYLARTDTDGTRTHLTDILGSTTAELDASVTTQAEYTYEPFGKTELSGITGNALRYTGREDDASGLYYYRARYYHSGLQRFLAEDPLGFEGGDINLFAYVSNSPLNYTDPTGLILATYRLPTWHPCVTPLAGRKSWLASIISDLACSIAFTPPGGTLQGPSFIGLVKGPSIVIPKGATGPLPTRAAGSQFVGGSGGGNGLHPKVTAVRIMEPNKLNPNGRVTYMNRSDQVVHPYTGEMLSKSDAWWHIQLPPGTFE